MLALSSDVVPREEASKYSLDYMCIVAHTQFYTNANHIDDRYFLSKIITLLRHK